MQAVNFGSENYMDLADALSMLVSEIMNEGSGYNPFPDIYGQDDPDSDDRDSGKPITAGLLKKKF
jgi:hypothetical protein